MVFPFHRITRPPRRYRASLLTQLGPIVLPSLAMLPFAALAMVVGHITQEPEPRCCGDDIAVLGSHPVKVSRFARPAFYPATKLVHGHGAGDRTVPSRHEGRDGGSLFVHGWSRLLGAYGLANAENEERIVIRRDGGTNVGRPQSMTASSPDAAAEVEDALASHEDSDFGCLSSVFVPARIERSTA